MNLIFFPFVSTLVTFFTCRAEKRIEGKTDHGSLISKHADVGTVYFIDIQISRWGGHGSKLPKKMFA